MERVRGRILSTFEGSGEDERYLYVGESEKAEMKVEVKRKEQRRYD